MLADVCPYDPPARRAFRRTLPPRYGESVRLDTMFGGLRVRVWRAQRNVEPVIDWRWPPGDSPRYYERCSPWPRPIYVRVGSVVAYVPKSVLAMEGV